MKSSGEQGQVTSRGPFQTGLLYESWTRKAFLEQLKATMAWTPLLVPLTSSIRSLWLTLLIIPPNFSSFSYIKIFTSEVDYLLLLYTAVFSHICIEYVHESSKTGNSQYIARQALL